MSQRRGGTFGTMKDPAKNSFIGAGGVLDVKRQPTLLFNGYADEVASLYRGLNLRENY